MPGSEPLIHSHHSRVFSRRVSRLSCHFMMHENVIFTTTLHFWRVKHSERKLSRCRKTTAAAKQVHTETAVCRSRLYLPAPLGSKQAAAALQWTALSHVLHDWEGLMLRCSYRMCRPDVYFAVKFEPTVDVDLSTHQHPKVWIHLL